MRCKKLPLMCSKGHKGFRSPCQPCTGEGCAPPPEVDWRARAEKAEAERDEYAAGWEKATIQFSAELGQVTGERDLARRLAVTIIPGGGGGAFEVVGPQGRRLCAEEMRWTHGSYTWFRTREEAEAAIKLVPWWEEVTQ